MKELLDRLDRYIEAHPKTAFFKSPASEADLAHVESVLGIAIPGQYRAFLLRHDGGFINIAGRGEDGDASREEDRAPDDWNSNLLLGTLEIVREYTQHARIGKDSFGFKGVWPFLPFCDTAFQETLVLDTGTFPPRVVDAFHEVGPADWQTLYPSFAMFLKAYLDGNGSVETIASG